MKITRLKITDYAGIHQADLDIASEGALIVGDNATGKTSLLRAVRACVLGEGCSPADIRLGADRSEIIIDMDALRLRRAINGKGSTFTVKDTDGNTWGKPQARINELFGASLDPLAFFTAKADERRRLVLSAIPMTVTAEDVARWIPGVAEPAAIVSLDGHGLEALGRLRKFYYELRAGKNKRAKEAEAAAKLAVDAATKTAAGVDLLLVDADAAAVAMQSAAAELRDLQAQAQAAERARAATEGTRQHIAMLRQRAAETRAAAPAVPTEEEISDIGQRSVALSEKEDKLRVELAAVLNAKRILDAEGAKLTVRLDTADRAEKTADALDLQASEAEGSLRDVEALGVTATALAQAEAQAEAAAAHHRACQRSKEARAALDAAEAAEKEAAARAAEAEALGEIVTTLTDVAPRELAERSHGIPGLALTDDGITLDGKVIENLSGAERMRFAVDLAKRVSRGKILIVDELEKIAPARQREFVRLATAGGYQLLATRVADGELVVEAIEEDEGQAEAAE